MATNIEDEKKALKLKKSRIEAKERLLKLKERKKRTRLLIEIGGLAAKAGIDHLNTNTLLGAFLEIKLASNDEGIVKKWTQNGAETFEADNQESGEALILTFDSEPDRAVKIRIREAGLKWNRFRKEWYGYGNHEEILKAFPEATVEKVS